VRRRLRGDRVVRRTAQGAWVAANAWRFGFIVRYEDGQTAITGYEAEPWHLRYIGPELAQVYHDGGFHTLEDFFGLPAAPGYVDWTRRDRVPQLMMKPNAMNSGT
jgi:hypothetical protein